jgi:hypothetical protein
VEADVATGALRVDNEMEAFHSVHSNRGHFSRAAGDLRKIDADLMRAVLKYVASVEAAAWRRDTATVAHRKRNGQGAAGHGELNVG